MYGKGLIEVKLCYVMGKMDKPTRRRIALTLDEEVLQYLENGIKMGIWYNASHAVEVIIKQYMRRDAKSKVKSWEELFEEIGK